MKVKEVIKFKDYPNYSIEIGISSWTEKLPKTEHEESIRNRFNSTSGKFNHRASCELPFWDLEQMMIEALKRDKISKERMLIVLNELSKSLLRQEK